MIFVDRTTRRPPPSLYSEAAEAALRDARDFHEIPPAERSQRRFEFRAQVWRDPQVVRELLSLFNGKCAFCESPLTRWGDKCHFRPPSNARDPFLGTVAPDHYWWLAYEWRNLYAICATCDRNLGTQFPVRDGRRVSASEKLSAEQPLLLDPCADDPQEYLEFRDAVVYPRAGIPPAMAERAEATIRIFGLNREDLLPGRSEAESETRMRLARILDGRLTNALTIRRALATAFAKDRPHHAARRGVTIELVRRLGADAAALQEKLVAEGYAAEWLDSLVREQWRQRRETRPAPPPDLGDARPSVEEPAAPARPATATASPTPDSPHIELKTTSVTRVEISDFRSIRHLDLRLVPADDEDAPAADPKEKRGQGWTVLLGENGAGKSSVVQAVCLALAGQRKARGWVKARDVLRLAPSGEDQPERGRVRVHLSTESAPIEVEITRGKVRFIRGAAGAGTFLRAYGSTRLPQSPRSRRRISTDLVRIDNLFDPFTPLHPADRWLKELALRRESRKAEEAETARRKFDAVALALKDLLRLGEHDVLDYDPALEDVVIRSQGKAPQPLRRLSDGYQTVIALAIDIIAGLPPAEVDFSVCPGIVLLDELGTHLHPRWRMVIVGSLRKAFASMQFIATTHEPLCLRGLREGEIVVMRNDDGDVAATTRLPSPEGMRVDQLLTSPFFGLFSTIEPEVDREFMEYYRLLALQAPTEDDARKRDALKVKLSRHGVLGYTRRDQLVYEAIDDYLAHGGAKSLESLPPGKKEEIRAIWDRVAEVRQASR